MAHARDHFLSDITTLFEVDPMRANQEIGVMGKNVGIGEIDATPSTPRLDAVSLVGVVVARWRARPYRARGGSQRERQARIARVSMKK